MQHALFQTKNSVVTALEVRKKALEKSQNEKWQCVKDILYEEYLWDMRCWQKPKYEYTKEETKEHIRTWISDHQQGRWTNNCGHCLYCIHKLLHMKWADWEEVIRLVMRNNNIKYQDQIGTWGLGFDEEPTETKQVLQ